MAIPSWLLFFAILGPKNHITFSIFLLLQRETKRTVRQDLNVLYKKFSRVYAKNKDATTNIQLLLLEHLKEIHSQ